MVIDDPKGKVPDSKPQDPNIVKEEVPKVVPPPPPKVDIPDDVTADLYWIEEQIRNSQRTGND